MKPIQSLALSLSLGVLVACQSSSPLTQNPTQPVNQSPTNKGVNESLVPMPPIEALKTLSPALLIPDSQQASAQQEHISGQDQLKPSPEAQLSRSGQTVHLNMQLPPLPQAFRTQALDLAAAAKIRVKLTDSNGNTYSPAGADGNGDLAYPVGGNFNVSFNNVYPDRLIVAEFEVRDNTAQIPQTQLALAFEHLSNSTPNLTMNMSTSPTGKAMKALLGANRTRARAINLADLQTFVNTITGKAGTAPNLTYTIHPELVKTAQLATDLATQDPGALTAANYRFNGATVNATVSGLVVSDTLELQVTDAASALKTNAGNGLQAILKAASGMGLNILARSSGTPGTTYTFNLTPSALTLTEGGTQAVTVTATPATPSITSLSSSSGTIGSSLTITGTNFHTATAGNVVKFGTTNATVTAASATSLTVTVPTGISGAQNISVQVGGQTSANTAADDFAIVPTIASLSTSSGSIGSSITITGSGFSTTPANNTVKFGSTNATVTAATATTLTVTVPTGISGAQNISVQVGGQTSANTAADDFAIVPTIASLSTSSGSIGSSITITGSGFSTTPANNTVKFGSTNATVTAATATTLTVTVPTGISGAQDVSVQVGTQTSANTAADDFTVRPSITSLSASTGVIGTSITINGSGFSFTPASNSVKFGTTNATVTAATATTLTVTIPNGLTGTQNVSVTVAGLSNSGTFNFTAYVMQPQTSGTSSDLLGITYGSGLYVVSGDSGNILTSPDAISWTPRTSGVTWTLEDVKYLNGQQFIIVGGAGTILTSPDAINWTSRTSNTSNQLYSSTYGASLFVIVGSGGKILTSPDGVTWTDRASGTSNSLLRVNFANNQFIAVGMSGTVLTSPDGITWTAQNTGTTENLDDVIYANSKYSVSTWSGNILSSTDGITWTSQSTGVVERLHALTYANGKYMVVGLVNTGGGRVLTSPDGVTWTIHNSGESTGRFMDVVYNTGPFVVVGENGKIYTSVGL